MQEREVKTKIFTDTLATYKKLLDQDIAEYSQQVKKSTLQNYGRNSRIATDAYLEILSRGGKRIRGALCMLGYEMSGGRDTQMIIKAARALEMLHAYILIIDDIQDRSAVRRDGPTAHILLADYHKKHELAGDADHFGLSIALNAALGGAHAANTILANLDVHEELRNKVVSIANMTMSVTAHGQTNDIMNEVVAEVSEADVQRVLDWKTARYTFLNPLHVGMVLAGADCHATDAITEYAMQAGKLFQISDDILGTFGSEFESGKSPMDDTREGKRTVLTVFALQHANNGNHNFLLQMLGNERLRPAEFERCKKIIEECGALEHAKKEAKKAADKAITALEPVKQMWPKEGVAFLEQLVTYMLNRKS
jgi:geranylgeranyl diphosphate synthase type I